MKEPSPTERRVPTPDERTATLIQIANRALLIYVARFRKECEAKLAAQEAAARKDAA